MRALLLLAGALALAGCATQPELAPTEPAPVCKALIGPITYTSTNKASLRYAGPALAPELKKRNAVGVNLNCPQYRTPR